MNRSNYNPIAATGTAELKAYLSKATYRGFGVALALMTAGLMLILIQTNLIHPPTTIGMHTTIIDIGKFTEIVEKPIVPEKVISIPQEIVNRVLLGNGEQAGDFVPVKDELFKDNGKEVADFKNQGNSTHDGRKGTVNITDLPPETIISNTPVTIVKESDEPIWTNVEKEPAVDLSEIQRNVIYPELALRARIEGTVKVGVLVSKNGDPIKTEVLSSANILLTNAAIEAIMKTKFAPAVQNSIPVDCWISIPINFKIR